MKKEISEPKYLEVACQSLILTKSEIWELQTQIQACPKGKYDFPCAIHTNPFYKSMNKKKFCTKLFPHQTRNTENMGNILYTPLSFNITA